MTTYLINHLRIPGDIPNNDGLSYLEAVEATVAPFGGKWLAQGPVDVVEGAWPGSVVLMEFPSREAATKWYDSAAYAAIRPLRTKKRHLRPRPDRPDSRRLHDQGLRGRGPQSHCGKVV